MFKFSLICLLLASPATLEARELSPREQQKEVESRISPSWSERLEYRDKQRAHEERAAQRKHDREWQRLEGPSWSEKDEEFDHSDID